MALDMIAADFGIRQLHARFADAVWRQDAESFAACWSSAGTWKIAGLDMQGREAIQTGCGQLLGRCTRIHLVIGQPILIEEGACVRGRLGVTEFAWMPDGTQFITFGQYHDRYVEEAGAWRFAERFWSFKYRGPIDLSAPLVPTPDYGAFPGAPGPDEETYVRKA
ncbi:nuclear transport factor 2 family protein [Novosphingobium sp. BW1]|uniref:nuclear transport factor 2 family protein n=1 Tax=Novosphingobium sp. BW1 TaxID=2592621 RepID=UPI0011DEB682|nr:nuclear transport factor 2 family protein [Novosphingobium sp. BW1]TYC89592.1 nuclear transport factor 2 family protein [Novosphingobium sp. BW1]